MESILTEIKSKKTKTVRSSDEIRAEIESHGRHNRIMRLTIIGARRHAEKLREAVRWHFAQTDHNINFYVGTDENHIENRQSVFHGMTVDTLFKPLACAEAILKTLESCPAHTAAFEKIQPLHDELIEAENREALLQAEANRAANELQAAKDAARQEMESKLDEHPLVVEAAKKVAPFYRKGELVAP